MDYQIFPPEDLIDVTVELPLSKSVVNRKLIMKALAGVHIKSMGNVSADIKALLNGIENADKKEVNIGASGTAMRFLTAYYASLPGTDIILRGSERMCERPIKILVDALNSLGAQVEYCDNEGYPPLHIKGTKLDGGEIMMDSSVSSQYVTALLLIAPYMKNGLQIRLEGEAVSKSYIKMTVDMMVRHGIDAEIAHNIISVNPGRYQFQDDDNELDWSAASYWAAIVALSAGFVNLPGLDLESVQADKAVSDLFEPLGVITSLNEEEDGVEFVANPEVHSRLTRDLNDNPDLAQTLAVTCAMLGMPFKFTGLSTLAIKETDRIEALKKELLKFGCIIEDYNHETIEWDGKRYPITELPVIETYNDHRMAMSFAPCALYVPGIIIKDVEVVEKSYPTFWEHLSTAGFQLKETGTSENAVSD